MLREQLRFKVLGDIDHIGQDTDDIDDTPVHLRQLNVTLLLVRVVGVGFGYSLEVLALMKVLDDDAVTQDEDVVDHVVVNFAADFGVFHGEVVSRLDYRVLGELRK